MSTADSPTPHFEVQLVQYLLSTRPGSLTIVGHRPEVDQQMATGAEGVVPVMQFESLAECYAAASPTASSTAGQPASVGSAALLHLNHNADCLQGNSLGIELGKAVRHFPERLVVTIDSTEPADTAFFAFGFRKLQLENQGSIRLFEYCLSEYKQPPDWLNARYWANPDRFGRDEDLDIYTEDDNDEDD